MNLSVKPKVTERAVTVDRIRSSSRRWLLLAAAMAAPAAYHVGAATPTLTPADVGYPTLPGSTTIAGGKITIVGGGNDIWNTSDNFHYAYFKATGDFDYVVKVEDLQGPDNWSKAELMARLDDGSGVPQGGDPHISNMTTRSGGQNQLAPQQRVNRDGASDWRSPTGTPRPTYPNTWLRMERIGSVFYLYYSADGKAWRLYEPNGMIDTAGSSPPGADNGTFFSEAWPSTILLGLAVTAHNDANPDGAKAVFSSFDAHVAVPIAITTQPAATVAISANKPLVLTVAATGDPVHYQWRKDGTDIAGARSATYTVALAKVSDSGTYTVRLFGAGKEVISGNSVVSVTPDVELPSLVSAIGSASLDSITVTFSEPLDPATAQAASNYKLSGAITISAATLSAAPNDNKVTLKTSKQSDGAAVTLTVNNVKDTAGNAIKASSTLDFLTAKFDGGWATYERWHNENGNPGNIAAFSTSIADGSIRPPDFSSAVRRLGAPWAARDNYSAKVSGFFTPPSNGNYVFFTSSDDASNFYLSTDDSPANKKLVAQETGWSNQYQWLTANGGAPDTKRSDQFAGTEWPTGNTITLQAGKKYYAEILLDEGGGGDGADVTFIKEGEADPPTTVAGMRMIGDVIGTYLNPNGASVTITQQPQNATVIQSRTATFTVAATGASPYGATVLYRWQSASKGSTAFSDIAGATGTSYTTPPLSLAEDGTQYRAVASVPTLGVNSSVATVTVNRDTTPPTVVSAGAISGDNQVGVLLDEPLDQASAETPANYKVSGATVTGAKLLLNRLVKLDLSGVAPASFTVTVSGVKDGAGNAMASATVNGAVSNMKAEDIGTPGTDPLLAGDAFAFGADGFYLAGGGHDIWDNADGFQYVYRQFTGPFDMRANVLSLAGTHQWAKAELMARESLNGGSRHADVAATRSDGNGQNQLTWQWRDTTDGASGSLAGASRVNLRNNANYPNTWIRLVRESATSNEFKAYWSNDGAKWNLLSAHTIPSSAEPVLPATLYVGMAVTSHDNGASTPLAEGIFSAFTVQTWQAVVDPKLTVSVEGGQVVISWAAGTLQSAATVNGPYAAVTGAASPFKVTSQPGARFYRVQQ